MKGVLAILVALALACVPAVANPPLEEPTQYQQFCERQLVSGTGYIDVATSIVDKRIALEYYDMMTGDGTIEMDAVHVYSQEPNRLIRKVPNYAYDWEDPDNKTNATRDAKLNFYENTKMTYDAKNAPLQGGKFVNSKAFYGGIGANIQEMFSVNQMEKDQTVFFGSTNNSTITHTVGLSTLNSFNGTWGTDSSMHKIFYKDIKSHELFSGEFEVQKEIKFHENPVPEDKFFRPCAGVDC
ncbi:hypothetical protein P0O24_03345 [Methanotrichaceae archaeon M04Ac]|uniref:Lipoprotein n=1 Tax=Candidatus Methanocrinis alkalitolerans TaxID=3033395 RepID=A0ABT5XD78_9EURY|nr:hypothetical protein [Candidatus Methanocrinis alkalitolerans]MCR3884049.1 hypothetical protein [Methanothrix sp.]MDF0592615.1 hypothetical protein [Candidatus Methanocrinis alkalitolerans]